jgi:acyl-CoA thioesterase-1
VSGDTSAGGLRRLEWVLQSDPDVLVVELGANDGLRAGPLDELESNLRAIVRGAQSRGVRVLLVGMNITPNLGVEYARGFEQLYERVAREEGAALAPRFLAGVGGDPRLNLEDGLHPTAEGHERLATNLAPHLEAVLDQLARQ